METSVNSAKTPEQKLEEFYQFHANREITPFVPKQFRGHRLRNIYMFLQWCYTRTAKPGVEISWWNLALQYELKLIKEMIRLLPIKPTSHVDISRAEEVYGKNYQYWYYHVLRQATLLASTMMADPSTEVTISLELDDTCHSCAAQTIDPNNPTEIGGAHCLNTTGDEDGEYVKKITWILNSKQDFALIQEAMPLLGNYLLQNDQKPILDWLVLKQTSPQLELGKILKTAAVLLKVNLKADIVQKKLDSLAIALASELGVKTSEDWWEDRGKISDMRMQLSMFTGDPEAYYATKRIYSSQLLDNVVKVGSYKKILKDALGQEVVLDRKEVLVKIGMLQSLDALDYLYHATRMVI